MVFTNDAIGLIVGLKVKWLQSLFKTFQQLVIGRRNKFFKGRNEFKNRNSIAYNLVQLQNIKNDLQFSNYHYALLL
jgi:hypothetical protein